MRSGPLLRESFHRRAAVTFGERAGRPTIHPCASTSSRGSTRRLAPVHRHPHPPCGAARVAESAGAGKPDGARRLRGRPAVGRFAGWDTPRVGWDSREYPIEYTRASGDLGRSENPAGPTTQSPAFADLSFAPRSRDAAGGRPREAPERGVQPNDRACGAANGMRVGRQSG
jgi:hypothetical protein